MSKIEAKKIVKKYAKKLKENNFPFDSIYLFGSYAKNKANKLSDLDVAVVSDKLKKQWWKNEMLLSHFSLDVDTRIEPYGFTVNDFKDNANPMAHEIRKTGIKVV